MKTESQIVEETKATLAAGGDPFGDNEDLSEAALASTPEEIDSTAKGENTSADDAVETKEPDAALSEDQLNAIANGDEVDNDPLQILNFNAEVPADYKSARTTLMAEEADALEKLMGGEIDTKEFAAIKSRVSDGLEELTASRIRAETLQDAAAQSNAQYQQKAIQNLISRAKDEIPYATDTKAQRQFDIALAGIKSDPDNAGKDFASIVSEAHAVVKAIRGIATKVEPIGKTADELAAIALARKPKVDAPATLRSLPAAATPNTGGSVIDSLGQLKGQQYEAAFAKLTPSQRASLLDE